MTSRIILAVFWSQFAGCLCSYVYEGVHLGPFPPLGNTPAVPQMPEVIQISFHLFTRSNPNVPVIVTPRTISSIVTIKPTIIIIHGFGGSCGRNWVERMINELFQKGDFNVFCLDWSNGAILEPGSRESSYLQAVANTRVTGAIAAVFIDALTANAGVSYSDVYLIGHSLGAHVAGYAGERLFGLLGRITGLDPAGPAFEGTPANVRLDASDAQFVDVIHTNGNKPMSRHDMERSGLGIYEKSGHADFYVNGGVFQPGCDFSLLGLFFGGQKERSILCSHLRSLDLYIETINMCKFTGVFCATPLDRFRGTCDQWFMGFDAALNTDVNNYPVRTGDKPLYCEVY